MAWLKAIGATLNLAYVTRFEVTGTEQHRIRAYLVDGSSAELNMPLFDTRPEAQAYLDRYLVGHMDAGAS